MKIFGALVRAMRVNEGISQEKLGERVGYSKSQVAMVENGTRMPSADFVRGAEETFGAPGVLGAAVPYLKRAHFPEWFGEYVDREAEAISLYCYDTLMIKGLLQTEGYARAVFSARCPVMDDEEIESRVAARLSRHALLTRKPTALLCFIMEEWVLRRPLGGRAVMKGQLEHLLELTAMRNVQIQIMPTLTESHAGFSGPMTLIECPTHQWLGYVGGQAGGVLTDDRNEVSEFQQRYAMIRSQALAVGDSMKLIEQMAGEL